MIIEKIINNNIISAFDPTGREVVIMGRGIGFGTGTGKAVQDDRIEKVFKITNRDLTEQFKELLANMPLERVQISNETISYAEDILGLKFNQSIYVTLTDHINFTIERHSQGINPENGLLWEIKRFYGQEYQVGRYAVDIIRERLGIDLPDDEAGFIALHFINAEYCKDTRSASSFPRMIEKILDTVKRDFKTELNEDSLSYEEFVIHLKFLLQRVFQTEGTMASDSELIDSVRGSFRREYGCAEKIAQFIEREADRQVCKEEIAYLAFQIRRVIKNK